jgi:DNA polymerase-3 subunit gamma/tau
MSYQVLARKWRPRTFREMVGQEHVLQALVNALDNNRLHHAYLFTGTRGVGKTTIARILAKCLNCERGVSSEPCGECPSCREIAEGRSVDLIEVDAASRTKVEDTRELLENVQYAPTNSRYKVYLIDEVHMLSGHSFNALLKTLEEPPPHVKFLLATTDPQKLPATILSRCLQFNLKNMPPDQIVGHLLRVLRDEGVECEEPALWLLARAANGSMRDALSLTDQAIAFGSGRLTEGNVRSMLGTVDLDFVYQLLDGVAGGEPAPILQVVDRMAEHAPDFEGSLDEMISLLHRVAIAQAVPDAIDDRWGDAEKVSDLASRMTAEDAQLFYQIAINGKRDVPLAPDPRVGFEMALLRMVAFRPAAAEVDILEPGGNPEPAPSTGVAAQEVGASVKKPADGDGLEALTPESWPRFLEQLGLLGIVYNIASHCELRHRRDNQLSFVLDAGNSSLFNDGHREKIRLALENYFGQPLEILIDTGEPRRETPAMRQQRLAAERQREAVAEIESDPQLQHLIARFDGELDPASIVPTDS